jgi:hypothetical protein
MAERSTGARQSDEEILAALDAAPDAFAAFYRRHVAELLRDFVGRTNNAPLAADLCAETFAAALDGAHRFDPSDGSAAAWLFELAERELAQRRSSRSSSRARRARRCAPRSRESRRSRSWPPSPHSCCGAGRATTNVPPRSGARQCCRRPQSSGWRRCTLSRSARNPRAMSPMTLRRSTGSRS